MTDDLDLRLNDYRVNGADAALLERIVAAAAATPQRPSANGWTWSLRAWGLQLAALACLGAFGFWSGNLLAPLESETPVKATVAAAASVRTGAAAGDADYLNTMVFGETNWKEINL